MSESLLLCYPLQYEHTWLKVGDLVWVHGDRESSMWGPHIFSLMPVAIAHVPCSVGKGYSTYAPVVELHHLFFEAWYGGQGAIYSDTESPEWHKLLERVPNKFWWTKIDLVGQLQLLVCLGTKVHLATHYPAELIHQQEWHLCGSIHQTFSASLWACWKNSWEVLCLPSECCEQRYGPWDTCPFNHQWGCPYHSRLDHLEIQVKPCCCIFELVSDLWTLRFGCHPPCW